MSATGGALERGRTQKSLQHTLHNTDTGASRRAQLDTAQLPRVWGAFASNHSKLQAPVLPLLYMPYTTAKTGPIWWGEHRVCFVWHILHQLIRAACNGTLRRSGSYAIMHMHTCALLARGQIRALEISSATLEGNSKPPPRK